MAARLKTLRRQRGNVQASITTFMKKLETWQNEPDTRDAQLLETSLEYLQKSFSKFDDIQEELEELDETEIPHRETMQENYILAVAKARQYLKEVTPPTSGESVTSHNSCNSHQSQMAQPASGFRLPRLQIPRFSGDLSSWRTFYNVFRVTIHESQALTAIDKFHYLTTHLSGEALDLVKGLDGTQENYKVAFDLLCERYNSERRHVFHHMNSLLDQPELKHSSQLSAFVAKIHENTQALEAIGIEINKYDPLLVASLFRKLSPYYRRRFDDYRGINTEYPKADELFEFLKKECLAADDSEQSPRIRKESKPKALVAAASQKPSQFIKPNDFQKKNQQCTCCDETHPLFYCSVFKQMRVPERRALAQKAGVCFNCLRSDGHRKSQCKNVGRCRRCNSDHHTLLCLSPDNSINSSVNQDSQKSVDSCPSGNSSAVNDATIKAVGLTASAHNTSQPSTVLLGSAAIRVRGGAGHFYTLRGVIDSAASCSFITQTSAHRIGLKYNKMSEPVSGIGGGQTNAGITGHTTCFIKPLHSDEPLLPTETKIIKKIVDLPYTCSSYDLKSHFSNLTLADDHFDANTEVEFLIGADVFPHIYTGSKIFGPPGVPAALASIFGWVITGKVGPSDNAVNAHTSLIVTDSVLQKFWEIEEVPSSSRPAHPDDEAAEQIYKEKHYRLPNGRYVAPILLREDAPPLGDSREIAFRRLKGIERRLNDNPELKSKYTEFLEEYESLNHMNAVTPQSETKAAYYIPHHCVIRPDSATTKLRVVFDASQKTSSGFSLNDCLYTGQKLQKEVFDVIVRFRVHSKVLTCDISKMYRQILLRAEDRKYQHILWHKNGKLTEFELLTVTYGTKSAPYVSLRTVQQLKEDEGQNYPLASRTIDKNIFVDDIAAGCKDTATLVELQRQLIELFKLGGFELQKWASNCPEILDCVPQELRSASLELNDETSTLKILGIHWKAQQDYFYYVCITMPHSATKRNILSQIARIFDPLGLISPIVFKAKTMMQKLWIAGLDWDTPLTSELESEWTQFYGKLPSISNLKIDRCVIVQNATTNSLIGFSDASKRGYAACVYLRSEAPETTKVSLLAAKSKVAPTKTVSIPRLELCGAQLLSSLITHIKDQLNDDITVRHIAAFTDSTTVLTWIKTLPCQLKTYEANRVTHILDRVEPSCWKFIPGDQNPSDLGSRGCDADELQDHPLWWTGPLWLLDPIEEWPKFKPDLRPKLTTALITISNELWDPLKTRFSSFTKLQRVTAWVLRFVNNLRQAENNREKAPSLSLKELNSSLLCTIKAVQNNHFADEINLLKTSGTTPKQMKHLQPFIDQDGVLRVGGRLRNANLPFDSKHPILLPKHDEFVHLLIDAYHLRYLHAGPRLLQSLLARQFWILAARSVIRSRLSKCLKCFEVKPKNVHQLMGDLPPSRVCPSKAFLDVALDFGGPILIREHKRRNPKLTKAYICLIVCLATRAVHIETVSDLSAEAFLSALDRFISRRGLCRKIMSDNATNFTGARRHLSELYKYLILNKTTIDEKLSTKQIEWSFLPPHAPNFGGIHEAGIKTAKYHLKRAIGEQTLTFEELSTVLTKIEAIMNSRPLCQLSTDAAENDVLTPGHFLIGGPLVALPEYNFTGTPTNRLSRWQLLQKLTQQFWKNWSRDYLHTLIQRSKWQQRNKNLELNTVVILAEDNTPPLQWKKGIIEAVHPGKDGVVRVATVRTSNGTFKRPASKLYPLPNQ